VTPQLIDEKVAEGDQTPFHGGNGGSNPPGDAIPQFSRLEPLCRGGIRGTRLGKDEIQEVACSGEPAEVSPGDSVSPGRRCEAT